MCNGRSLSEWRLPDDGDDWSNAWRRMMEGGDGLAPIRAPNPSRAPGAQGYDEWGDKLCLPVGDVHFHGPCDVSRALVIEGHGHMNTRVYFHGCDGFRFWSRGSTSNPRPGNSGGGSSLNNMAVFSAETALPSAVGIRCEAPIRAENLHIQGFPSHGIAVDADRHRGDLTYDDPLTGSNANKCSFLNVRATLNGGHGWLFKGGDANACVLIGVGAENNGQWGFRDESFLGQWVLGAHASGNGDPTNPSHGDYWAARGGQHGVWLVYEESPNVAAGSLRRSHIYPPNIVINPRILVDEHNPLTWTSILGSDTASLVVGGLRAKRFGASCFNYVGAARRGHFRKVRRRYELGLLELGNPTFGRPRWPNLTSVQESGCPGSVRRRTGTNSRVVR